MEVRDEIMLQIILGDAQNPYVKQGIIDCLTSGSRDDQITKANALLSKKGKDVEERISGLENFEKNRRASRGT